MKQVMSSMGTISIVLLSSYLLFGCGSKSLKSELQENKRTEVNDIQEDSELAISSSNLNTPVSNCKVKFSLSKRWGGEDAMNETVTQQAANACVNGRTSFSRFTWTKTLSKGNAKTGRACAQAAESFFIGCKQRIHNRFGRNSERSALLVTKVRVSAVVGKRQNSIHTVSSTWGCYWNFRLEGVSMPGKYGGTTIGTKYYNMRDYWGAVSDGRGTTPRRGYGKRAKPVTSTTSFQKCMDSRFGVANWFIRNKNPNRIWGHIKHINDKGYIPVGASSGRWREYGSAFINQTAELTTHKITLRTRIKNHLVGAVRDHVEATSSFPGVHKAFRLIDLNGGRLMSGDQIQLAAWNGKYLSAPGGGGGSLRSNAVRPGGIETFTIVKADGSSGLISSNDQIALQTSRGLYVVAEQGGGDVLNANRDRLGSWEKFSITFQ